MVDCFAKWKIVLAIKSDTNNVLVTQSERAEASAYVLCKSVSWRPTFWLENPGNEKKTKQKKTRDSSKSATKHTEK